MIDGHKQPCDEGVMRAGAEATPCAEAAKPWVLAASAQGVASAPARITPSSQGCL